jgi:hypothetical protein
LQHAGSVQGNVTGALALQNSALACLRRDLYGTPLEMDQDDWAVFCNLCEALHIARFQIALPFSQKGQLIALIARGYRYDPTR